MNGLTSFDTDVDAVLTELTPISIEALNVNAALQKRTDRKYLIDHETYSKMVDDNRQRFAVLDVGGRRSFGYQSVYFDNVNFDSYRGSAQLSSASKASV